MPEDGNRGVQPDIVFVTAARRHIITEDGIRGAPDLVIEILSPSTARRDRTVKCHLYERHGIPEYWVADPDAKQVEAWPFAQGATEPERYVDRVPVRLGGREVGSIDLAAVFDWPR